MACCGHEASRLTWGLSLCKVIKKSASLLLSSTFSWPLFWTTSWWRDRKKESKNSDEEKSVYKGEGRRRLGQCSHWMQSWFLCALLRLTSLGQIKPGGLSVWVKWTGRKTSDRRGFICDSVCSIMNSHVIQWIKTHLWVGFEGKHMAVMKCRTIA